MPSADQVPVINPHSTMRWHKWVVLIAGSTGSALRAVRPPNLHITPAVRPMMRRGTGLNSHQAWWQLLEKRQDRAPLQLARTPGTRSYRAINAASLREALRQTAEERHGRR